MKRSTYLLMSLLINSINTFSMQHEITFIQQFISNNALVFDVGAHHGKKTDIYLTCGASVLCIEPQPKCIAELHKKYINNTKVTIIPKGLAEKEGALKLAICSSAPTISTFSQEWQNGRFFEQGYKWDTFISVEVTTLDFLIKAYGKPQFCKIDVEGFEYEVLKGLSTPIPYLSFEFTKEGITSLEKCLDHLISLGYNKFNFCLAETPSFFFNNWVNNTTLIEKINKLGKINNDLWGDIYAYYE